MAIPVGKNDLKLFRRHSDNCARYPNVRNKKPTYRPRTDKEKKEDALCIPTCFIHAIGYLANETEMHNGKLRAKRVRPSLGVKDWHLADLAVAALYKTGKVPEAKTATAVHHDVHAVHGAVKRFITTLENEPDPEEKIQQRTVKQHKVMLEKRLLKYCDDNGITDLAHFEHLDNCKRFMETWRYLPSKYRNKNTNGKALLSTTYKRLRRLFKTFLNFCVGNRWMRVSGLSFERKRKKAKANVGQHGIPSMDMVLRTKHAITPAEYKRLKAHILKNDLGKAYARIQALRDHGYSYEKIARILNDEGFVTSYGHAWTRYRAAELTPAMVAEQKLHHDEAMAAIDLMYWTGMRFSDCHKFNEAEVVVVKGRLKARFIQQKTREICTTPLEPAWVVTQLEALPGCQRTGLVAGTEDLYYTEGVKHYFTLTYNALWKAVVKISKEVQKETGKFTYHFSPHCLRHSYVLNHMHNGTPQHVVSKNIGHKDIMTTMREYGNWTEETTELADQATEANVTKLLKKIEDVSIPVNVREHPAPTDAPAQFYPTKKQERSNWAKSERGKAILSTGNRPEHRRKSAAKHRSVTPKQAEQIRRRLLAGEKRATLMLEFDISDSTLSSIVAHRHGY